MVRGLIRLSYDFHVFEHVVVIADSQWFSTRCSYVFKDDLLCLYIRKLLFIGVIGHIGIKIGKNSYPLIIFRMIGVVYHKIFNEDCFGHITRISKIMLTRIRTTYQIGGDRSPV